MKERYLTDKQIRLRTWFSFLFFIIAFCLGIVVWFWLRNQPAGQGNMAGIPKPLRSGLNINDKLFTSTFNPNSLMPEFPKSQAVKKARVNGNIGMSEKKFDPQSWKLQVLKTNGDTLYFNLDDIKKSNPF